MKEAIGNCSEQSKQESSAELSEQEGSFKQSKLTGSKIRSNEMFGFLSFDVSKSFSGFSESRWMISSISFLRS